MLTIPFVLLVLAILVSLASVICHLALPSILRSLEPVGPELRAQLLLFVAAAPWLIGTSVLVSSLGDIVFGACDFGSACLWNEDPAGIRPLSIVLVAPLLCVTILAGLRALWHGGNARKVLAAFDAAAIATLDEPPVHLIPSPAALAFAGRGRVYVSTALRDSLPAEQYAAVIRHEQAHLRRRDGVILSIARILAGSYVGPFRRRLLNALALANEQACDAHAAAFVGANAVAAAILAVERMSAGQTPAALPGFADGFAVPRIRRLLKTEMPSARAGLPGTAIALAVIFAFLAGDVLYYLAMMILYPGV
jgi:Zn-dependent protease with chaperone function